MQDSVFHAAHVEINPTGIFDVGGTCISRSHPVLLDLRIDERLGVGRIQITELVPAGPGPLRHHIEFASICLHALAQIHFDGCPLRRPAQRRDRGGIRVLRIEGLGGVVVHLRQLHRQHVLRQRDRQIVLVVDDGERLTPVALPAEQPVPQPVLHFRRAQNRYLPTSRS